MFEIDFFKLIIVAMIGLLVLGPEKLPGVVAKLGRWVGRARSMARQFRTQLEQEVLLEEARQQNKQTIRQPAAPPTTSAQSSPAATEVPAAPAHSPEHAEGHTPTEPVAHTPVSSVDDVAPNSQVARTHD
jgi:sec-independent protein translocase protein TatB